jgi:hypothetical protein
MLRETTHEHRGGGMAASTHHHPHVGQHVRHPLEEPGAEEVAGIVYGAIAVGAAIAVAASYESSAWAISLTVVATAIIYWLVHVYCDVLGRRAYERTRAPRADTISAAFAEAPILEGSLPPTVVLLIATIVGASGSRAALWGMLAVIATLVVWPLVFIGRRRGSVREALLEAMVGGVIGVGLLLLKFALH